jgi:hypothetical protein
MRKTAGPLAFLVCLAALAGCSGGRIVSAEGPRVTYSWDARETTITRVVNQASFYCSRWGAPPQLFDNQVEGTRHTTTFVCRERPTLPLRRLF